MFFRARKVFGTFEKRAPTVDVDFDGEPKLMRTTPIGSAKLRSQRLEPPFVVAMPGCLL